MKIGPVDIRNHTFSKRGMRGIEESEVTAYLDLVADRLEEEILETEELKAQIDRLEARLAEYGGLEKTLRDSLVAGERLAEERLDQADRESKIRMQQAEVEAEKIVGGARGEVARLRAAMDDLRRQRITYAERFRALLRSQFKILEASLESYDPESSEVEHVLARIDEELGGGSVAALESDDHRREQPEIVTEVHPVAEMPAPESTDAHGNPQSFAAVAPETPEAPDAVTYYDGRETSPAPASPESADYLGEKGLFASQPEERRPEE